VANFVAFQAVNINALPGFSILAGPIIPLVHSGTELKIEDTAGDVVIDLKGTRFNYLGTTPIAGTINSIEVDLNGSIAYRWTGLSISVPQLVSTANQAAHTGNFGPVLGLFFGGNDHVRGSAGNDFLIGVGGNDSITGAGGDDTMRGGPGNDTFIFRAAFRS